MDARGDRAREEDRLLHDWTPRILRGALAASVILLVIGLCVIAATAPAGYAAEFQALRHGRAAHPPQGVAKTLREAWQGQGRAILLSGLLVLTLVPTGRVAFCLLVFLRERDWIFSTLTALVLGLLCVGVLLGRVG
jgi:uncharacterized membrane protein